MARIVAATLAWERLSGCRIVVTGASGLLGNYLVRTLLALRAGVHVEKPVEVVAVVRNMARAQCRFADLKAHPQLTLVPWDLSTLAVPDFGPIHYVLHAGSQASPRYYGEDPVGTILPNVTGTAALLEALRRAEDPRGFLLMSAGAVYGALSSEEPIPENQFGPLDPASIHACYPESKRLAETLCVSWQHQHGLPSYIVRPFHTYGPGLLPDDGRAFADFIFAAVQGQPLVLNSDGSTLRVFCYAADAIEATFAILLKGEAGVAYNLANPHGVCSILELAELIAAQYAHTGVRLEQRAETPDGRVYTKAVQARQVPDVQRLAALGWRARTPVREGFVRTIDAYRG